MASVTDIITYIGIPLAVLGVLPIIYTSIKALLTLQSVQRELKRNGHGYAITRGSLMSGTIEVEIPRCCITPLERYEADYWTMSKLPSKLRGGSWSIFNWNRLITGQRLYRLQYMDDLREPQAEVEFEELLSFLLDRGAIPDLNGFHKLRTSGIWTPFGTSLLLSPDSVHGVLKVALPDDSDGILSLSLQWCDAWDKRSHESLPPSWMRLEAPRNASTLSNGEAVAEVRPDILAKELDLSNEPEKLSIRFNLSHNGESCYLDNAIYEIEHEPIESNPDTSHLRRPNTPICWFALAASALGHQKGMGLSNCAVPERIRLMLGKDSMPCGIMVLLDLLEENDTPTWATQYDPNVDFNKKLSAFSARHRKIAAEQTMPPAQAQAARATREAEERTAFLESTRAQMAERQAREEKRIFEALNSPRLGNSLVAKACLKSLIAKREMDEGSSVQQAVEHIMYQMIIDVSTAERVSNMLDRWMKWTEQGGMSKEHLDYLKADTSTLCYVACILSLMQETLSKNESSVAADMQECMRLYRKVRLG